MVVYRMGSATNDNLTPRPARIRPRPQANSPMSDVPISNHGLASVASRSESATGKIDWGELHRDIQSALDALDDRVRHGVPDVRVHSGSNAGATCQLFSYRVYSRPDATE